MLLKKELEIWQGKRNAKTAAADLDIPLATFRKYRNGKRTPNKLALAELKRRMQTSKIPQSDWRDSITLKAQSISDKFEAMK
jgi:hypothetical protein